MIGAAWALAIVAVLLLAAGFVIAVGNGDRVSAHWPTITGLPKGAKTAIEERAQSAIIMLSGLVVAVAALVAAGLASVPP